LIEIVLDRVPGELRSARQAVRTGLTNEGLGTSDAQAVVAVVNELVSAARECRVTSPLALTIVTYGRLTSVRVRCDRDVDVHDEPFGVRERLLGGLTFAFGRRGRPDGSVDLWAEIVTS
jgi:ethanolamine ammonia-lyase large subunit